MLCKAAIMGDRESYFKIARSQLHPGQIKKMGRQVKGFEERKWMEKECSVAFQVVYQKFSKRGSTIDAMVLKHAHKMNCPVANRGLMAHSLA